MTKSQSSHTLLNLNESSGTKSKIKGVRWVDLPFKIGELISVLFDILSISNNKKSFSKIREQISKRTEIDFILKSEAPKINLQLKINHL